MSQAPRKRIIWVAVKVMVLFWILSIVRHLVFRGPEGDFNLDSRPYRVYMGS